MLIDFRCRRCRAPLCIEADQQGNTIHCPSCDCEMAVPAASEPDTPRGEMVQGVYALLGEVEAPQESKPVSGPASLGYGLPADPVLHELPEEPTQDLLPSSLGAAPKRKKRRRRRHAADSPSRQARRWSPRAMVLASGLVLVIAVIGSAKYVRHGEDSDASAAPDAPAPIGETSAPALAASLSAPVPNLGPAVAGGQEGGTVVPKNQRQESKGPQKSSGERQTASELLTSARRAANEKTLSPLPAAAVPPAPSTAIAPDSSFSQMTIPVIKRRRNLSEEDLRKELRLAPEIPNLEPAVMSRLVSAQKVHYDTYKTIEREPRVLLKARPDLKTLPVRQGRECRLDKRSAANLAAFSAKLHLLVDKAPPEESNDKHGMPALLQKFLRTEVRSKGPEWLRPEAAPALQQILMQENKPLRWMLVEILSSIHGPEAGAALAKRAIYDLSPEVRAVAIQALKDRPLKEYRQVLLDGLRHPWAPVADHAAEALAALKVREVVPILVAYLAEPEPNDPVPSAPSLTLPQGRGRAGVGVVREMVRVSHAANCLMCHPPAGTTADPAAAVVPGLFLLGSRQGPRFGRYGSEVSISLPTQSSFFVRVDTTFFRQDFSVREPVKTPGTDLVSYPRFDYLVRTRKVKTVEAKELKAKAQQRDSILFALRQLSGTDAGVDTNAWANLFPPAQLDDEGLAPKW